MSGGVISYDSSDPISAAIVAELIAAGARVICVGPMPIKPKPFSLEDAWKPMIPKLSPPNPHGPERKGKRGKIKKW